MFPVTTDLVTADRDHRLEDFHDRSHHHLPTPAGVTSTGRPARRRHHHFHLPVGVLGR